MTAAQLTLFAMFCFFVGAAAGYFISRFAKRSAHQFADDVVARLQREGLL